MIKFTVFCKAYTNLPDIRRFHFFYQANLERTGNNVKVGVFKEAAKAQEIIAVADGETVHFACEMAGHRQRLLPARMASVDRCRVAI